MREEQLAESSRAKPLAASATLHKTLLCQMKGFILWLRGTEEDSG